MKRFYKVDFLLPETNIVIECNGEQWKRDIEYDKKRDNFIKENGFTLINIKNKEIFKDVKSCVDILHNLSVEIDQSYIAKGFVVHNCRCERYAQWITEGRTVNQPWTRPSPYDEPYQIIRDDNGNLIVPELADLFR